MMIIITLTSHHRLSFSFFWLFTLSAIESFGEDGRRGKAREESPAHAEAFVDTFPNLSSVFSADNDSSASSSQPKNFSIVCCMGGVPELVHPDLVSNFTLHSASYVIEDRGIGLSVADLASQNCRLFHGSVLLSWPLSPLSYAGHQVTCKCPELGMSRTLDRNCRRLPSCLNNGIHSLMDPRRCFCLDPFFGERCEKICDQGRRIKGSDGRDRCSCVPFYRGEECREAICLNGGRLSEGGHCECAPYFLGFHCEIDANRTIPSRAHEFGNSRFQRFGGDNGNEFFSRDVSGTVFSLVMIVVLVLSMYLLMKHRMQVQSRYLSSRRADLLSACTFPSGNAGGSHHFVSTVPGSARRVGLFPIGNDANRPANSAASFGSRTFPSLARSLAPFLLSGADAGPPPYAPPGQRVRRSRNEALPPLPSYEDATKLPALIPAAQENTDEQRHGIEERAGREAEEQRQRNEERAGRETEEQRQRNGERMGREAEEQTGGEDEAVTEAAAGQAEEGAIGRPIPR
ncbi:hypothetical protein niasHS_010946 [Heterodera schachtii]|uniref:EGF-like domain-containing protein n=1 Tax=Heterodera schachtii TaxID=97005 RepID=A0ABD2IT15_HETSC